MFSLFESPSKATRRDFLRIGTLGLGGLTLSHLLGARATAAEAGTALAEKSVIFLFQHGGPSQFETFDPKMSAPAEIRCQTGEIATSLPGVTFGSTFPRLARLADKIAVVRSYVPGDGNHDAKPIVHRETLGCNLGSFYSRVVGLNHPTTGMPTNMLLYPQAIDPAAQAQRLDLGNFPATGPLGNAYAPFMPGGNTTLQKNMRLAIPRSRLDERRAILAQLDTMRRDLDRSGTVETMDRYQGQAREVIVRGVADAFDLTREAPQVLARYDTAPLVHPDSINKKWSNHRWYADHGRTLGKLLLLARRLCEAGCGFVTVTTNFVWDMHADVNNAPLTEAMGYVGRPFDHAVSALIEDIEARGLSDRILLVACGEMGRTPRVNREGGRDHWGNLGPLLIYGGGLRMGQVVGRSTRDGGDPASEPVRIRNLIATIMHYLLDINQVRVMRGIQGDVSRVITEGNPIAQLMP
jgi:hypothetical protein